MAGGSEARDRLATALDRLLPLAVDLFEPTDGDVEAVAEGVVAAPAAELEAEWRERVEVVVGGAGHGCVGRHPSRRPGRSVGDAAACGPRASTGSTPR